jgi:hypothetical protein
LVPFKDLWQWTDLRTGLTVAHVVTHTTIAAVSDLPVITVSLTSSIFGVVAALY